MFEPFLVTAATVFVAEFGDKSLLVGMVLASRFQRVWAVIAGAGTGLFLNHLIAAAAGALAAQLVPDELLRWVVAGGFFAAAAWMLLGSDADGAPRLPAFASAGWGPFLVAAITFFVMEFGDKTQLMVVALAARFEAPAMVVAGSWTGVMLALVPALLLAERLLARLNAELLRYGSAAVFAGVGLLTLIA